MLEQKIKDWQPLGYFSRMFTETERNYRADGGELRPLSNSVSFIRGMIEGNPLELRTDFKPLVYSFQQRSRKASHR